MYDILTGGKAIQLLEPTTYVGHVDAFMVDTLGYESIIFILTFGSTTGGTATVQMFHGDSDVFASAAQVSSDDIILNGNPLLFNSATASGLNPTYSYRGSKRFVGIRLFETTTWSGWDVAEIALLLGPKSIPFR